jgi:hypothetical protein
MSAHLAFTELLVKHMCTAKKISCAFTKLVVKSLNSEKASNTILVPTLGFESPDDEVTETQRGIDVKNVECMTIVC